jgi:hypothetical protein
MSRMKKHPPENDTKGMKKIKNISILYDYVAFMQITQLLY